MLIHKTRDKNQGRESALKEDYYSDSEDGFYNSYSIGEMVQRHRCYFETIKDKEYNKIIFNDGVYASFLSLKITKTFAGVIEGDLRIGTLDTMNQERAKSTERGYLAIEPELVFEILKPYRYEVILMSDCPIGQEDVSELKLVWYGYAEINPLMVLSKIAATVNWRDKAKDGDIEIFC